MTFLLRLESLFFFFFLSHLAFYVSHSPPLDSPPELSLTELDGLSVRLRAQGKVAIRAMLNGGLTQFSLARWRIAGIFSRYFFLLLDFSFALDRRTGGPSEAGAARGKTNPGAAMA